MIFKIFKRDLKKIFTNSMAIILAVGIAVLPSLYAWINIYANWDPYGSTGNMQVAVIIEDEGCTYRDIHINVGEQIETNLKGNDAINWQFVDKKTGMDGVMASKYYAAIEIPKDFSKNLASIITSEYTQPKITYYANEKKNAIATKITDKVVETVQTEVNESFVETVVGVFEEVLGTVIGEVNKTDGDSMIKSIVGQIDEAKSSINAVRKTLDGFNDVMKITDQLGSSLSNDNVERILGNADSLVKNTEDVVKITSATVGSITSSVDTVLNEASKSLNEVSKSIENAGNSTNSEVKNELEKVYITISGITTKLDSLTETMHSIKDSLPSDIPAFDKSITKIEDINSSLKSLLSTIEKAKNSDNPKQYAESISQTINKISSSLTTVTNDYKNNVKPVLESTITSLLSVLSDLSNVISSIDSEMPTMNSLASSLNNSLSAGNNMVSALTSMLDTCEKDLTSLTKKINSLSESEVINTILNITSGSDEDIGKFLACPVDIDTEKVYAIDNYGSAMAPFYSTLAIWVGAIILVAVFKTNVKKKKELGNVKPIHEYVGRGLLFMLFSLIQSIIICVGDLCFLRIQCYHPVKFVLAGAFAGLVFSMFIYSLVYAFGDIGKAVAVIMLVLQLGGSGGTFPIDVTPALFRIIYPYTPFTFVINAMRECICGTYSGDYWLDLLKLSAYIIVAIFFGTFVRWLFKNPMKLFTKRIEETGLF